ncbi:hypothetical protein RRG08_023923 [Elysia crispata]|uniref:Uncharacterized protein n=1 Tax=Elysia crispata TaxID=231223 RepID=A0AAE0YMR9_9GAST|nr:hypothetical protein RRG08_023923 [Elysia crispata]
MWGTKECRLFPPVIIHDGILGLSRQPYLVLQQFGTACNNALSALQMAPWGGTETAFFPEGPSEKSIMLMIHFRMDEIRMSLGDKGHKIYF